MERAIPSEILNHLFGQRRSDIGASSERDTRASVLYGISCCGKSFLLRALAEQSNTNYLLIDLTTDRELRTLLFDSLSDISTRSVVDVLCEAYGLPADRVRSTFLLIDGCELLGERFCRFFERELPYRSAYATNRPDLILNRIELNFSKDSPVMFHRIRPMQFTEFLTAIGHSDYCDVIRAFVRDKKPIPAILADDLTELYYDYMMTGGFPQAIRSYMESKADLSELRHAHESVFSVIKSRMIQPDIPYSQLISETRLLQLITYYRENGKEWIDGFRPGTIRRGLSRSNFENEHQLLCEAGLLIPVYTHSVDITAVERETAGLPAGEDCGVHYEIADQGLARFLLNDYESFYNLDESQLPYYMLLNSLYCDCDRHNIQICRERTGRNTIIPLILPKKNICVTIDVPGKRRSAKTQSEEHEKYILTNRNKESKHGDHNIMWFALNETLDAEKR